MMKKKMGVAVSALALTLCMSIPAFAGRWQQNTGGWSYQNDDGGYLADTWQWIEGKCYYFGGDGYMLSDTTTPDGHTVDATGAWTVDGVVQTQQNAAAETAKAASYGGVFAGPFYNDDGTTYTGYITIETLADGSITLTSQFGTFHYQYSGPFYGEGGGEVYAIENEEMKESVIFRGFDLCILGGSEFVRVQ